MENFRKERIVSKIVLCGFFAVSEANTARRALQQRIVWLASRASLT